MSQTLLDGLSVAFAGLVTTFLSLGLFGVLIYILGEVFKYKEEAPQPSEDEEESAAPVASVSEEDDIPVVIASAISYFRLKSQSSLGNSLQGGKGDWWSASRNKSQQGLGIRISRSGK